MIDDLFPCLCLVGHEIFSIADKRAKRRGIERLASADAGQCGIDQLDGLGNIIGLIGQAAALCAKQGSKIDRFMVKQSLDIAETEPGFL